MRLFLNPNKVVNPMTMIFKKIGVKKLDWIGLFIHILLCSNEILSLFSPGAAVEVEILGNLVSCDSIRLLPGLVPFLVQVLG
jgi:hypothetical protein